MNTLPEGIANVQLGQFGYARALLAESPTLGPGTLLYAFEYNHYDGPWDLPESSNRYNALLRYHWDHGRDDYTLTGERLLGAAVALDRSGRPAGHRRGAHRPLRRHRSDRRWEDRPRGAHLRLAPERRRRRHQAAALRLLLPPESLVGLHLRALLSVDRCHESNCDQFEQIDRRFVTGGELKRIWERLWWGKKVENTVGLQVRNDYIPDSGLNNTVDRQVVKVEIYDHIEEPNAGVYASNQIQWTRWFRSQLGLRGDLFAVDVNSNTAANSGNSTAGIVSPKATLVFGPWKKTEIYLDAGVGLSQQRRPRRDHHRPSGDGGRSRQVPLLVRTKGAEIGARTSIVPGLVSTLSFWFLQSNSELTFSGDAGDTEANGPSRRYGIEWANFYKPTRWLTLSADFSFAHARYTDPQEAVDGTVRASTSPTRFPW